MAYNFDINDFRQLAFSLVNDAQGKFENGKVADRLQTFFADRNLSAPGKNASLELRNNLAKVINDIYREGAGGKVKIPAAVAKALNVDKTASGFTIGKDGSVVATNHPLTERRLVCIMTALCLDARFYGNQCADVESRARTLFAGTEAKSARFEQAASFLNDRMSSLLGEIRGAAEQRVKPETLRRFAETVRNDATALKEMFTALESGFTETERAATRELINDALEIARQFGVDVGEGLRAPAPLFLAQPEPAVIEEIAVQEDPQPSAEQLEADCRQQVEVKLNRSIGETLERLGIDLGENLGFSDEELNVYRESRSDEAHQTAAERSIADKVRVIAGAVNEIANADLKETERTNFIKAALAGNGEIDKAALAEAERQCRTERFGKIAAEKKAAFDGKVAELVAKRLAENPQCALGLENLNRDFPQPKRFTQKMKANRQGGALELFDLKDPATVMAKTAGKLEGLKTVFDQVDITKDERTFIADLDQAAEDAAEAIAGRLERVLTADVFEDDRTLLAELALDPSRADQLDGKLAEATKKYSDNLVKRIEQAQMGGKIAATRMKNGPKEAAVKRASKQFEEVFGFSDNEKWMVENELAAAKEIKLKAGKDESALEKTDSQVDAGANLRDSVRNLFADLFTKKGADEEAVRNLLNANASTLQAMLLDPSLLDTMRIPGGDAGSAAVRTLLATLLEKISDGVNGGQLTAADFKEALEGELRNNAAVKDFATGIRAAGEEVLASMQKRLTAELTDVLRQLSTGGKGLQIHEQTLAELGASGLGSMDEGYGKFLANVLDNYFKDPLLASDHDRMLESMFRNGKEGGTVGDALSALIKGAGPIFQKVLQSVPTEGLPAEIVKALADVKSGLAPIPQDVIDERLAAMKAKYNQPGRQPGISDITIDKSLGAASVGQALLCTVKFSDGRKEEVVVKLLRPGVDDIVARERLFFDAMAGQVDASMQKTFAARMDSIEKELDFTNEAQGIRDGQCYGNAENYPDVAKLGKDNKWRLKFESMGMSKTFEPTKDTLVLSVAKGKPLDRCTLELRQKLDKILKRITKTKTDEHGNKQTVLETKTGYELLSNRNELVTMYNTAGKQRKMLEELMRRFSAEIFLHNFKGDSTGGGFMHGDLHGGNLLVSDNVMTVIDFGNSMVCSPEERKQLVRFVGACGLSRADYALDSIGQLLNQKIRKLPNYKALEGDIKEILTKGGGLDVISRGMAVVQYLQRHNIQVPPVIMNFTETVMRLSTAYQESVKLMDDIAHTIEESRVDPNASTEYDPIAANFRNAFKASNENVFGHERHVGYGKAHSMYREIDTLFMTKEAITPELYREVIVPMLDLMRGIRVPSPYEDGVSVSKIANELTRQFKLLEAKIQKPGGLSQSDPVVMSMISRLMSAASSFVNGAAMDMTGGRVFVPEAGEGVNECMADGLYSMSKEELADILTNGNKTDYVGLLFTLKNVKSQARAALRRQRIAASATVAYQRNHGLVKSVTRRFVNRFIEDHFIWNEGDPSSIFGSSSWYSNPAQLAKVKSAIKFNLGKLREGLAAAKMEGGEHVERFALIQFAIKYGLVEALHGLNDKEMQKLRAELGDDGVFAQLEFLRKDASLVRSLQFEECVAKALKKETEPDTLLACYSKADYEYDHLPSTDTSGPKFQQTVKFLGEMLVDIQQKITVAANNGEIEIYSAQMQPTIDCVFMRMLSNEGMLDKLADLPKKDLGAALKEFGNSKVGGSKELKNMMERIFEYMKT